MMYLQSKKSVIILVILVVGMFVLHYFLFTDIKRRNENASLLTHDISSEVSKQQYILSLQNMIENANSDISRVHNSMISKEGDVEFIEQLEKMAKDSGLTLNIDSLSLENEKILTGSDVAILRIKAKTLGSWSGTYTFLSKLESMPLQIKVNKFDLANTADTVPDGVKKIVNPLSSWRSDFDISLLKYK